MATRKIHAIGWDNKAFCKNPRAVRFGEDGKHRDVTCLACWGVIEGGRTTSATSAQRHKTPASVSTDIGAV